MKIDLFPHQKSTHSEYLVSATAIVLQLLANYSNPEEYPTVSNSDLQSIINFNSNNGDFLPAIYRLFQAFELSNLEKLILLLCAGWELDPSFAEFIADINQDETLDYPSMDLVGKVFDNDSFLTNYHQSNLIKWELIFLGDNKLVSSPLTINRQILDYLLGDEKIDKVLSSKIKPLQNKSNVNHLSLSHQTIFNQISYFWSDNPDNFLIQLTSSESLSKINIATLFSQEIGYQLYKLDANFLPKDTDELERFIFLWSRECRLNSNILLFDCSSISVSNHEQIRAINFFLDNIDFLIIISSYERSELSSNPIPTWEIPPLTLDEQKLVWQNSLGEHHPQLHKQIDLLVSNFQLTSNEISHVARETLSRIKNEDNQIEIQSTLWNACRTQSRTSLDNLAERLEVKADWDDLILPPEGKKLLREMVSSIRYKSLVYERWGFGGKSNRGFGTCALFAGVSGTGKTMAAEVIANELELDLYRVDLSSVVSKYIGETEKNLSRLFDAAETGGGILLFDEGETLFSKRSEVNDSKDKYANMEVSYLLQRLEAYPGLAIITTNIADSLDSAFIRRLRYIINFPFPKPHQRALIWQKTYPEGVLNIQDPHVFERLALLEVSGGLIRSIAIKSAFIAAEANKKGVDMNDIYQAVESEYSKLGRTIAPVEIQGWDIDKSLLMRERKSQTWDIDKPKKPFEVGFDKFSSSWSEENTQFNNINPNQEASPVWKHGAIGDIEQPIEQMDEDTLVDWITKKLDGSEPIIAELLTKYAMEKYPDELTFQYWLAVTYIYQINPYETAESVLRLSKAALKIFDSIEEGEDELWGIPEPNASIDYWRGVVLNEMGADSQHIKDFFQKYLDVSPNGMFAVEATDYLESISTKNLIEKDD